jgi:hypothetical protein
MRAWGERKWTPIVDFSIVFLPVSGLSAIRVGDTIYGTRGLWAAERPEYDGQERSYQVMNPIHIDHLDYVLKRLSEHTATDNLGKNVPMSTAQIRRPAVYSHLQGSKNRARG